MVFRESLHANQRVLTAEDRQDRIEQLPALWERMPRRIRKSGIALRK